MLAAANGPEQGRDWLVTVGLGVAAASAAATSFQGLMSLAQAAGWTPAMSFLLPLSVDALSLSASRVWLTQSMSSKRARRFARNTAIGAIGLSLAGNAVWHLIAAQLLVVSWIIVVAVGAIPPLVMGFCSHLAVLRRQVEVVQAVPESVPKDGETVPMKTGTVSGTVESAPVRPRGDPGDLLQAARQTAADYEARYGKRISRDELRRALRVGGSKASELLRQLRAESA